MMMMNDDDDFAGSLGRIPSPYLKKVRPGMEQSDWLI